MSHKCHAIGCGTPCKPEHLMCKDCWGIVPKSKQQRVYDEYRAGQCNLNPMPSPQWHDAADVAIYYVYIRRLQNKIKELKNELISA